MRFNNTPDVPEDFLAAPAENMTVKRIDWSQTPIPRYEGLYAVIIDNVLTPSECEQLRNYAEQSTTKGWERATVNMSAGEQRLLTEERHCGRIFWDCQNVATRLWKRIEQLPVVQEIARLENRPLIHGNGPVKRGEVWRLSRPNERMRFLKYVGGEYFRPHIDGSYDLPDKRERSYFTLHLYLNNSEGNLVGGATSFHSLNMVDKFDVAPKAGRVLLFQHRNLLHSGEDVVQGTKYTMRTDIMFELESTQSEERSHMQVLYDKPVDSGKDGRDNVNDANGARHI